MEWNNYRTCIDYFYKEAVSNKIPRYKNLSRLAFGKKMSKEVLSLGFKNEGIWIMQEAYWEKSLRPFYNVWPCIGEALAKTSLKLEGIHLIAGAKSLWTEHRIGHGIILRWPRGNELDGRIRSAFACVRPVLNQSVKLSREYGFDGIGDIWEQPIANIRGYDLWIRAIADDCVSIQNTKYPKYWETVFPLETGKTLETLLGENDKLNNSKGKTPLDEGFTAEELVMMTRLARVVTAVYLMANGGGADILTPIVARKDQAQYDLNRNTKLVTRARAQGILGWDVGKHVVVSPHMRRPHFGLRWTETGKKVPKIVPIKGCLVRRNKVTEVPTGFLDKEQ